MTSVTFSISRVNRLRRAAHRARAPADLTDSRDEPDGWSISACDPNDLLGVFKALRLKAGFALHAYEFRSGGNGNGVIWAVPADAPLLAPEDCPQPEDVFLGPPKPAGAIPLMQAIEGDGSPWSYLSASILGREAAEFGALWHGCVWSDQKIIAKPPREAEGREASRAPDHRSDAPMSAWIWEGPFPRHGSRATPRRERPSESCSTSRTPSARTRIYRATDTYVADSYVSETDTAVLCTGPGGFVY